MSCSKLSAGAVLQSLGFGIASLICALCAGAPVAAQPASGLSPAFVDMPKSPEGFTRNTLTPEAEMRLAWRAVVKCQRRDAKSVVLGARPAAVPETLWPLPGPCPVYSFDDLDFSYGWERRLTFEHRSMASCSDSADKAKGCQKGKLKLSEAHLFLTAGDRSRLVAQLAALKPGQGLKWSILRGKGAVEAVADISIGGVACRTYRWSAQGYFDAERDGLLCRYAPKGATTASWVEVV